MNTMSITTNRTHVSTVIGAFLLIMGAFAYHIERRLSDLRSEINHRFKDLYRYLEKEPK
jgi:hypothetical protein